MLEGCSWKQEGGGRGGGALPECFEFTQPMLFDVRYQRLVDFAPNLYWKVCVINRQNESGKLSYMQSNYVIGGIVITLYLF